jgi:hypothetical protein
LLLRSWFNRCTLLLTIFSILSIGCGLNANETDSGPTGKLTKTKSSKPIIELLSPAPAKLYYLEAIAGSTFEGINKENWPHAEEGLANLSAAWQEAKQSINDEKGVKSVDESLDKLSSSITEKQITASYENLNKLMANIGDIAKLYKLSPLSDIIAVDNAVRSTSFYIEEKNWLKASVKVKALETTWNQIKPGLEKFGIIGEITKAHSYVNQIKDAVNGENKDNADDKINDINASLGTIREYYCGN